MLLGLCDYQAARIMFEKALSAFEYSFEPDHCTRVTGVKNLVNLLVEMGEDEAACVVLSKLRNKYQLDRFLNV